MGKSIGVRLSDSQENKLNRICEKNKISNSAFIKLLLDHYDEDKDSLRVKDENITFKLEELLNIIDSIDSKELQEQITEKVVGLCHYLK